MPSGFPGALDNFATNKANATSAPADHPAHHNDLADAVNKIEAELGPIPSGSYATVKERLDGQDLRTVHDATTRNLAALDTWEDIANTSTTFTPPVAGDYLVIFTFTWRGASGNWKQHSIRCLVDGATTGVTPPDWQVHRINFNADTTEFHTQTIQFLIDDLSAAAHTVKMQTSDTTSGLDREFTRTFVSILRVN